MDQKPNLFEIFEKISKIFKNVLKKIAKNPLVSIFFTKFNKPFVIFCAFERKTQFTGNIWENFQNTCLIKLRKKSLANVKQLKNMHSIVGTTAVFLIDCD